MTMHARDRKTGEAKCGADRREPSSLFGQRVTCPACRALRVMAKHETPKEDK